jgi:hypothetical protein
MPTWTRFDAGKVPSTAATDHRRGLPKTEARNRLKELVRDRDDDVLIAAQSYTVRHAVQEWLDHGLGGRDPSTVQTLRNLTLRHAVPDLGRRKLRDLSAGDVDRRLADKADELSTSTVSWSSRS